MKNRLEPFSYVSLLTRFLLVLACANIPDLLIASAKPQPQTECDKFLAMLSEPFEVEDGQESVARFLKRHSKLFKLYHLIRRGREITGVEMIRDSTGNPKRGATHRIRVGDREYDASWSKAAHKEGSDLPTLRANLERLVHEVRKGGVRPVLLTYAADTAGYARANRMIREAAIATSSDLVDIADVFALHCKDAACLELLFSDQHPRVEGHELIASTLIKRLPQILGLGAESDPSSN